MRYIDEFRDSERIRATLDEIRAAVVPGQPRPLMEICGGHTHAIFRFGLSELLPAEIELVHGPGCPVCVLPRQRVSEGLSLLAEPDVIFTAYGDMMRVPGARGSALDYKARGADVRMVYSPLDALRLAERNPERRVVFFAIGFETTAPATALTLQHARRERIRNFFVHCNHILVPPAIRALLEGGDVRIDGFLGPGHVSTVIGCAPYEFISRDYGRPVVVSGFEPLDILQALLLLLRQLRRGEARVENQYPRAVAWHGNPAALRVLDEVFEPRDSFEWRGLGRIPASGLRLRPEFAEWDAEVALPIRLEDNAPEPQAPCGAVLRGLMKPRACPLFGRECTPAQPVGALMVSSEGACAAHFQHGGGARSPGQAVVAT